MRELLLCGWFLLTCLLGEPALPCRTKLADPGRSGAAGPLPAESGCGAREAVLACLANRIGLVSRRQADACAGRCGKTVSDRVASLLRLRKDLARLQAELLALLNQPPYSDNVKTTVRNIGALVNTLNAEFAQTLAGIERDTLLLATFDIRTGHPSDRLERRLANLRTAGAELASESRRIEELMKAMENEPARLGDLNGDGIITAQDLLLLVKPLGRKAAVAANADLDGNGRIDSSDFRFLQQAVYGNRTRFPADAASIPGDLNGDDRLDWMDLLDLAGIIRRNDSRPVVVKSPWDKQYDINADGRIDEADFQELVRSMAAQLPVSGPARPEIASGSVGR